MNIRFISYLTTTLALILLPIQSAYLQGYKIEASIKGVKDTSLILSYRYGTKFYSVDTARTDSYGNAIFSDTLDLNRGMYQVILPDKSFIDFFIDDSQNINITSVKNTLVDSLHSENSFPNEQFFLWQAENQKLRKRAQSLQKKTESLAADSPEQVVYQKELSQLREENKALWDNTIDKLSTFLPGKFLKGMRPFVVPDAVAKGPNGEIDQRAQYEYYKAHFFDAVDFSDAALIRTPLIQSKLEQFFTRVVPALPDSVIVYSKNVVDLTQEGSEIFQFVVQFLLNKYSDPKIMGMDAVYVYIADNYYLNGLAFWMEDNMLKSIRSRVETLRPLLLGKKPPALKGLETPEGERIDVDDINAEFIILYFWEPDCSFCKTETPKLKSVYDQLRNKNIEVVAVNTRLEKEPWEKFIVEHELNWINVFAPHDVRNVLKDYEAFSTPKLFILDKDKHIVAKDIAVDQVIQIIGYLMQE